MGVPELPKGTKYDPPLAVPFSDAISHFRGMQRAAQICAFCWFIIYYMHGGEDGLQYPAFGRAATWDIEWMLPILVRNILGCWLICAFWDWILYYSPLAPAFEPYKINEEYPTWS
jgi:hypothetical protein